MSHPTQQNQEMFQSMGIDQYQKKLLSSGIDEAQIKTNTLMNNEIGPLDISGGLSKERGLRKDDRSKQILALNKKLIKPLTGSNKNVNQSQQNLGFPAPQINSLLVGSPDAVLADSSRPMDRSDAPDKLHSLNFLSTGSQQHQSQKIRIPKHAIAQTNKRNPVEISQKGSFVSQRSTNQANKSISQQKHAKKNNQQFQQLHGHQGGLSTQQSSRFANNHANIQGLNSLHMHLNSKLKGAPTRDSLTHGERRPVLTSIPKPRFASNRNEDPVSSNQGTSTEPTLQPTTQLMQGTILEKNLTLNENGERKFVNSERISLDRASKNTDSVKRDNFNSLKNETKSQSRTIGQFIPAQSTNSIINTAQNQNLQLSGSQQQAQHILKQSKSNITSKTIGLMQQRMLKTSSTNEQTTENLLKQAHYITSQKPGQQIPQHQVQIQNVKVNPLMQSAEASNAMIGLPPMNANVVAAGPKSFVRSRGASSGTSSNMLTSKSMPEGKKQVGSNLTGAKNLHALNQPNPQVQGTEDVKKQSNPKQKGSLYSPETAPLTPYTENQQLKTTKRESSKSKQLIADEAKAAKLKFRSTPNSNNTTSIILGSGEQGQNQINADPLGGSNLTYRSENSAVKSSDNPIQGNQNKIQQKLNSLLTQAQVLPQDEGAEETMTHSRTPKMQSDKQTRLAVTDVTHHQNSLSASQENLSNQILPIHTNQSHKQSLQGSQQYAVPQPLLIKDQERERNDTIPEEPTISMDEFQSNTASFYGNPMAEQTGAPTSNPNGERLQKSFNANAASIINRSGTQYIDSESIQKQRDSERQQIKKPEEPAGPASIKGLNRRREHKLLQSQNLVSKNVTASEVFNQKPGRVEPYQVNQLQQSQSSDRLQSKRSINKIGPNSENEDMMTKLSDRLSQNPINLKSLSTDKKRSSHPQLASSNNQLKMQSTNNIGIDDLRKVESPNEDLDDKEFEDCDKEGQGVPDENPKVAPPKGQLHNSIAQRANRNQQLDQPSGDRNARPLSKPSGLPQSDTDERPKQSQTSIGYSNPNQLQQPQSASERRPSHSQTKNEQQPPQQPPPQPQSLRKVDDQVAQFAYLTRPGKTGEGVTKTNQDNFFVVKNFAKIENLWYFGVCDGHGQNGHYVSEYVKNKLALDIMEIDIALKEQQAMRLAQSKLKSTYEVTDQKNNSSFDTFEAMHQTGSSFYKRQQSHDGGVSGAAYNELGGINDRGLESSGSKGKLSKKRRSQDGKAAELSKLKSQIMKQITSNLLTDGQKLHKVFTEGFRKNDLGLKHQGFGFEFSGTTIVTAMVQGNRIVTANAGDSRTVIGSLRNQDYQLQDTENESKALSIEANEKAWFSKQITRDHKPDDPDEKARILSMNGRIESYKGRYGENVGPARVWLKKEQYPGLAMSRSIGDACAHSVGVSALPEIKEFHINDDDKFMILASDGVWEFLSNDEVIDLIVPFWHKNDLKGACSIVVKESVAAWEREEDSIDDITCIIVFFKRSGLLTDQNQERETNQNQHQRKASNTRESSLNPQQHNNNSGNISGHHSTSASQGDGRQPKGHHYQHKGRQLKKSKDTASQSSKK